MAHGRHYIRNAVWVVLSLCLGNLGCRASGLHHHQHKKMLAELANTDIARELQKVSLPPYVIEPPDVLLIEAVKIVPKPPFKIEPLDVLAVIVRGTSPDAPITGAYSVDPGGVIRLGPEYGSVHVAGLSIDEAKEAVETYLKDPKKGNIAEPLVTVELAQTHGLQQINGEHLVRLDGTVGLGSYGSVRLAGATLEEAKQTIELLLSDRLLKPEVFVDVIEHNSKVCYVIADGAGQGEQVARFPITGNETVLDVVSQINGLPPVSSKHRVWLSRPAPPELCCDQILPVDWEGITQRAATATNYQVLPGDRIYIHSDKMVAFGNFVDKVVYPFERMFGFTLLGHQTVRSIQFGHTGLGLGGGGGFGGIGNVGAGGGGGAVGP